MLLDAEPVAARFLDLSLGFGGFGKVAFVIVGPKGVGAG